LTRLYHFFAGFSLSWFITPLDGAVMESMSGKSRLTTSLSNSFRQIFTRPHQYVRLPEFRVVAITYGATYLAKNVTDSMCVTTKQSAQTTAFLKFWLVFAVNGGLSVFYKDPVLAKRFGNKPAAKLPTASYLWWAARDSLHIIGAVVLPDYLEKRYEWTHKQWQIAQVSFPLLVQFITTPCHLMGLDFYNQPQSSVWDRVNRTLKKAPSSISIRMVRMFAPWSIGLLINRDLRDYLLAETHN